MKLYNATLQKNGSLYIGPGMPVTMNPYPHVKIGTMHGASVWMNVGKRLVRVLTVMREYLCDNDGQPIGGTPCAHCKGKETKGAENEHPLVQRLVIQNPLEGTIIRGQNKTKNNPLGPLMLIEESPMDTNDRQIVIHFTAEGGYSGRSHIIPGKKEMVVTRGESLIEFKRDGMPLKGYASEVLLVVSAGDTFEVRRSGNLEGAPQHLVITVDKDFSLRVRGGNSADRVFHLDDGFDKDEANKSMETRIVSEEDPAPTSTGKPKDLETPAEKPAAGQTE